MNESYSISIYLNWFTVQISYNRAIEVANNSVEVTPRSLRKYAKPHYKHTKTNRVIRSTRETPEYNSEQNFDMGYP